MRGETPERVVSVLIADSQEIFRRGLQVVLQAADGVEVVGESEDGDEALELVKELIPDVIVVDVGMAGAPGTDLARRVVELFPDTGILMLASNERESDLYEAVKAGARGYLLKGVSGDEVVAAVRGLAQGQSSVSPTMTSKLLNEFSSLSRRAEGPVRQSASQVLSRRELEVLKLLAKGLTNREVAEELFISENTVKNHVRNILEKLQLRSRMLAVMYAVQERLIEPEALR